MRADGGRRNNSFSLWPKKRKSPNQQNPFRFDECDARRRIGLHGKRLTIGRVVLYVQHDWGLEKINVVP